MTRPRIISFICILGYIATVITFPQVFSPAIKKLGILIPALYGILVAAHFISCVGIWYMKKWGVFLFILAFFSKTVFFILTEQTEGAFYTGIAVSVFSIVFLIRRFPEMDSNL